MCCGNGLTNLPTKHSRKPMQRWSLHTVLAVLQTLPEKYRDGASQISGGYFRIVSNVLLRNSPWMSLCAFFPGGGATRSIPVHFSLTPGIGSCWFMLICAAYIHRVFLVQTAILDLNLVENPGLAALKNSCVRWLPYKQFMLGLVIIQWHETNTFFSSKRWR